VISRAVCAALVLLSSSSLPLGAESAPTTPIALAPTSTFRVEVDGAEIRSAETYVGESGLLILGCSLKGPILVVKVDKNVRYVPRENVIRDEEGNVSLKDKPSGPPICSYQTVSGQILFEAEGRKVRLSPKPPLVGPQTLEAIIEHNPDYESRIKGYRPDPVAVAYLSKYTRKTDLEIYFGTWCSVCEAWVPRLVKSLQAAGNSSFQTRFMALPRGFYSDPAVRGKQIQGIPTIILLQDGREVGRVQGRPESGTIEEAFVRVLRSISGS